MDDERKNEHPEALKNYDRIVEKREKELEDIIEQVIRSKWFIVAVYLGLLILSILVIKASWHCIMNDPCEACEQTKGKICHYIRIPYGQDSKEYMDFMKENLHSINQTNSTGS